MKPYYGDIRSKITDSPEWFTENGVPRYDPFEPSALGVYDVVAVLFLVECAGCGARIKVGAGRTLFTMTAMLYGKEPEAITVAKFVESWSCGDPPRHDCPGAGETMSAEEVTALEVWDRVKGQSWERQPKLEGLVD